MSIRKPVPAVTDWDFEIRTPGFIVVYGYVVHVMAVQYNKQRIMSVGDSVSYQRHGSFQVCYIHDGHAVIQHITLSGKVMTLLVPDKQWLNVSNGSYKTNSPYYPSFEETYRHLKANILVHFSESQFKRMLESGATHDELQHISACGNCYTTLGLVASGVKLQPECFA